MKLSLTVIALIGLAVFAPFLCYQGGNTKEMAKRTATVANALVLTRAFILYVPDSQGRVPADMRTAADLKHALGQHVDPHNFDTHNPSGGEFIPNADIAGKSLADLGKPESVIVLMESKPWPDGKKAIGFADGHVKRHGESTALQ